MNVIDLHQDIAGARLHPLLDIQTDFAQLEKANTKIVFATGFALPDETLEAVIAKDFAFYNEQCAKSPSWKFIKTAEDLKSVMSDPSAHGIIFHIEGFPGFAGDWQLLEQWYRQGLRSAGLVWNEDNLLGGGTNSNIGLTEIGREFIAWCEERNILIDLAHANPTMFKDCVAAAKKPLFISHGGLDSLVPSKRNYTNEQLKEVVAQGGVCGIFLAKSSMSAGEAFSVEDIAKHIKAAVDLLGEDAVALGTDFGGMISGTPQGLSSISDIENLWNELKILGFTSGQIEKIAFLNAQGYLETNLPR